MVGGPGQIAGQIAECQAPIPPPKALEWYMTNGLIDVRTLLAKEGITDSCGITYYMVSAN